MRTQFSPTYGDATLIFAFEAVIIGGLGSLWGTLIGGIVVSMYLPIFKLGAVV